MVLSYVRRSPVATLLLPSLIVSFALAAAPRVLAAAGAAEGRVIVLGFDGADARTTRELIDKGELPNLARLAEQGTFAGLESTYAAESPVAWAALNCGQNPAKTGVPGFIRRDLDEASGMPMPAGGHATTETRSVSEMELPMHLSLLSGTSAIQLAAVSGGLVFLVFLVVFGLLLRMGKVLSTALSLILGGAGAAGAWVASGYLPHDVPIVVANPIRTDAFWDVAARAGVESVVIDAAMAWDRPTVEGARVLGGLGVPDVRGKNGDWFVYTTDELQFERPPEGEPTSTAGTIFRVDERDGKIETRLYGPENFWRLESLRARVAELETELEATTGWKASRKIRDEKDALEDEIARLELEPVSVPLLVEKLGNDTVRITVGSEAPQEVKKGEWSGWFRPVFELNPLVKAGAVTRIKVVSVDEPCFRMYVNTLDIDPEKPPFWQPVSQPAGYSGELAREIGEPYQTVGWACATMAFKDEEIDVDTFLEDIENTLAWREKVIFSALEKGDWRLFFGVFSTTDRVQHMMYQYYDREHPLYDEAEASREVEFFGERVALRDVIPAIYRQMDRLVGRAQKLLRPDDTLLLCADHGFQTFRRGVHLNNWLVHAGYQKLRPGVRTSDRKILAWVDWPNTQAYALGLGMIYLNLKGREGQGSVDPADREKVLAALERDLLAAKDGDVPFVSRVTRLADVDTGPYVDMEADLMPGFAAGYRISWSTTLGNIKLTKDDGGAVVAGDAFEDNDKTWSGDHVSVDPDLVKGIFFCSRPLDLPEKGVHVLHVAPTVLDLLGVGVPAEYDVPALRPRP